MKVFHSRVVKIHEHNLFDPKLFNKQEPYEAKKMISNHSSMILSHSLKLSFSFEHDCLLLDFTIYNIVSSSIKRTIAEIEDKIIILLLKLNKLDMIWGFIWNSQFFLGKLSHMLHGLPKKTVIAMRPVFFSIHHPFLQTYQISGFHLLSSNIGQLKISWRAVYSKLRRWEQTYKYPIPRNNYHIYIGSLFQSTVYAKLN